MMSNILEYRNVDIHYGKKQVIENVLLSMKPGEILGIVGESGSGKSTLIKKYFHDDRERKEHIAWYGCTGV